MTKKQAYHFWSEYLRYLLIEKPSSLKNPCIDFTHNAKMGFYDNLTDEEYNEKLHEVEEISKAFNESPSASPTISVFSIAPTNLSNSVSNP